MTGDQHLYGILAREAVDTSATSPVRAAQAIVAPIIREWAGDKLVSIHPSGSFVKGTGNRSGTDLDLFISLSENTTETLKEIYDKLFDRLSDKGYAPKKQNVSVNIQVLGFSVDLVPGKRQNAGSLDHSLYVSRARTWQKTNVWTHIAAVRTQNRISEIRVLKLWRDQLGLDFPSFYLELVAARALSGRPLALAENVSLVFDYLRDSFMSARFVDPANSNNVISDELTIAEKRKICTAATEARKTLYWENVVR
jgi:hypothetical protein